jgi:hypothetical protein
MEYLKAINNHDKQYFKDNIKIINNEPILKNIIIKLFTNYKKIINTYDFDDFAYMIYIIKLIYKIIDKNKLLDILSDILIDNLNLIDYIYYNKFFSDNHNIIHILFKKNRNLNLQQIYYLQNIYEYFKGKNNVLDQIITNCHIIDAFADSTTVISNLIYMFKLIDKTEYNKYKIIYSSFDNYDLFYQINKNIPSINYFIIDILFLSVLDKLNYSIMHKLFKLILANKELIIYLQQKLKHNNNIVNKYKEISKNVDECIFISNEEQINLFKEFDKLFY